MAVLIASGLRKEFSGVPLFDGVSFTVERKHRLALSGQNGEGKTTLLRVIAGETDYQGGALAFEKGCRVALHDQRPPRNRTLTLRDYVLSGAADLVALEVELGRLEALMAAGDHDPATMRRWSEAHARLEHAGGYGWRDRAASVVRGLGFAERELDRTLDTFSGGELTRASLARALSSDPDLLLLDEPTNHLDMESLEWLEKELSTIDAAIILVAHDRWFLESVTTAVLELERGKGTYFPGTWHKWRGEKAARASALAKISERQAADLARLQTFVDRFRYGTKARQAQAKLKQMDRIQRTRVHAPGAGGRTFGFDFLDPPRSSRVVLEVLKLGLKAGDKELLHDVDFAVERGEHVAIVGPNGAGKTTLLETLLGRREQVAGKIRIGHGVEPAYFSQHEAELDERGTVLDAAVFGTGLKRPQAQALLGRFLFSGADVHEKQVKSLSGGERRRLSLAIVVASGANFLVLDEPTNHLDVESREALEEALDSFPGTVLLVSHDRALLDAVATRTLVVEGRMIRSYDGGWADVLARQAEELIPAPAPTPTKAKAGAGAAGAPALSKRPPKAPSSGRRRSELERVEAEIAAAEERLAQLEAKLADDWGDVDLIAAHRRVRDELPLLMEKWETLFAEVQETQAEAGAGAGAGTAGLS